MERDFSKFLLVFISYFLTAKFGLKLDAVSHFATLVWAPTGIALASILLFGLRLWPAIFAAAFLINYNIGGNFLAAVGIGLGNTLEAVVGAYFLLRFSGFQRSLSRIKDIIALLFYGCVLSTMVSATVGVASLWFNHMPTANLIDTWAAWWFGDMLGNLIVAPLILVWGTQLRSFAKKENKPRFDFETLLLAFSFLLVGITLFSGSLRALGIPTPTLPYILFPFMVWAALRFGQQGNTLIVFITSVLAIWYTTRGQGPFSFGALRENLMLLNGFISVMALTGLTLAASVMERKKAVEDQQKSEQAERFLMKASDILTGSLDYDTRLAKLVQLTLPELADWCIVDVCEDSQMNRVSVAHVDPEKETYLREVKEKYPPRIDSPQPAVKAVLNGHKNLIENVTYEKLRPFCYNEEHTQLILKAGIKSHLAVPLLFQNKVIGVLSLGRTTRSTFKKDEMTIIERLASRAALAIDNARLFKNSQADREKLKAAVEVRDTFLSIASHELRTPLTSLHLELQIIDRLVGKGNLKVDRLLEHVGLSKNQTRQLANLIDSLLDVTRLGSGKLSLQKEKADISDITQIIVNQFKHEADRMGSELIFANPTPVEAIVDKLRVTQAITNLVSNALKYGNGKPVNVSVNAVDGKVQVIVKDQGMGIAADDQKRVFERFERAVSHNAISGMGLGLYITREIAQAHGGTVTVESAVERGSTFTLELPLLKEESDLRMTAQVANAGRLK